MAAGVAGLLSCPLWFAMDFQGAAYKETAALQSRQNYLCTLGAKRGCAKLAPTPGNHRDDTRGDSLKNNISSTRAFDPIQFASD